MDSQDHKNTHASGHGHGVHVCHRCGYPFPNAHPSAKHRRAHKRVCGTIEGYKLVDSEHHNVSDDDHDQSDDERRTPSPKIVEKNGGGKVGESMNRSESEVFSDAVTEFPDSGVSPGIGEHLEDATVAVPATNGDKIAGKEFKDCTVFYSFNDSAIDDIVEPQLKSLDESLIQNPEDPKNKTNVSGSNLAEKNELASELGLVKPEIPTDASQETKTINVGDDVKEDVWLVPGEYLGQTSEAESKKKENEETTSEPMPPDGVLLWKEEHSGDMASKMSLSDPTPEVESFEHMNTADAAQVKVGAEQGIDPSSTINSEEVLSGMGEGKENVCKLSVPADIPVVENAESMLQGFKDHKGFKLLQPVTSDSCERIEGKKDDIEDPLSADNLTRFHSEHPSEVSKVSALDMHVLEDNHMHESKPMVENLSCEVKSDGPQILNEVKHTVGPVDVNAVGMHNAGNYERTTDEISDAAGKDENQNLREASYAKNSETTLESANLPDHKVNQTTSLHGSDDAGEHEKVKVENCSLVGVESRGESAEGRLPLKTETTFEFASSLHETQVSAEDVGPVSATKLPERVSNLDGVSAKDLTNGNVKVQGECVAEHGGNAEILERTPEVHAMTIPQSSPLDAESSLQISAATNDNNHGRELGGTDSVVNQSLQGENDDNNLLKNQLGVSAIDVSVDSLSQTDSLDANWGSISVVSAQSDTPPVVDTETLPSTDSLASTEAEKTNLKKGLTERQHSEKSEVFEAPSFMTLVEPGGGGDRKATASGTQQNLQQQNDSPSQAGWFPSLTHVVNESQGRKKNEERIAKVNNWSPTGKQHTPLKNLLGEANLESKPKSPKPRENKTSLSPHNETVARNNNGALVTTTVSSILSPEVPTTEHAKKDTVKEHDSPAEYPADIKREKRMVKRRPYWENFITQEQSSHRIDRRASGGAAPSKQKRTDIGIWRQSSWPLYLPILGPKKKQYCGTVFYKQRYDAQWPCRRIRLGKRDQISLW